MNHQVQVHCSITHKKLPKERNTTLGAHKNDAAFTTEEHSVQNRYENNWWFLHPVYLGNAECSRVLKEWLYEK